MKKLLSIAAVAALFTTGAMADIVLNEVHVNGAVEAGAQVSCGNPPAGTLVAGTFQFEGCDLELGNMALDEDTATIQELYVKTNALHGVNMTVTPAVGQDVDGGIKDASGHVIPVTYTYMATSLNNAGILASAPNDGSATVGTIEAVAHPAADQVSGTYKTILDVVLAAI